MVYSIIPDSNSTSSELQILHAIQPIMVKLQPQPNPRKTTEVCPGLTISKEKITSIQRLFKSDIRSMINYIQSNQYIIHQKDVIDDAIWLHLTSLLKNNKKNNKTKQHIYKISSEYNIEIKNIIKDYLNYIIHNRPEFVNSEFLKFTEFIVHLTHSHIEHMINYIILKLNYFFNEAVV